MILFVLLLLSSRLIVVGQGKEKKKTNSNRYWEGDAIDKGRLIAIKSCKSPASKER